MPTVEFKEKQWLSPVLVSGLSVTVMADQFDKKKQEKILKSIRIRNTVPQISWQQGLKS